MPVPIPVDVSPVSDGSAEKDWETAASGGMLKVSQWRQTILSFRSVDRRNAFLAAAHVVQSLAMGEEETGAKPSWLSNSAGAQKGMSMVAQHTGDVLHETCHCGPEASMSDEEEEDWELHRKKTGLVAKLVTYDSRERMLRDFKLRPGVRRSGIVVWGVAPRGPCARAGVQPGDRLVSINGRQDIIHLMASECKVPATLIFMGTAGRITTEVRLISSEAALSDKGFTLLSDKVLGGARTKYLYQEERVFVPRLASLALGVQAEPFRTPRQMFSLEPKEAARLLRRAKSEAEEQLRGGGPPSDPGVGARVPSLDTAEQQELWLEIPAPNFSDDELATGKPNRPRHCPERPKKEWREEELRRESSSLDEDSEAMEAEKV
ncbi:unnamed protein product [Durusdinium trenchii]|uniref:PDZ domain-containing protein n=1 Tax=Durusdinium trenchii TaxID=1381693 RepID=A0ABP0LZG4_9DINO